MSRAFVKELDGNEAEGELPDRVLSEHPLYVTPRGLRKLHGEVHELRTRRAQLLAMGDDLTATAQIKQVERDLRYAEAYLQNAIVVEPPPDQHEIRFGAKVELLDEDGQAHRFCIVGEHEACAAAGFISWISPLARQLIGGSVGNSIIWERPTGPLELEVTRISYPELR